MMGVLKIKSFFDRNKQGFVVVLQVELKLFFSTNSLIIYLPYPKKKSFLKQ